jgi:hypothetical protein
MACLILFLLIIVIIVIVQFQVIEKIPTLNFTANCTQGIRELR